MVNGKRIAKIRKNSIKKRVKREIKSLFKSMDFVSNKFFYKKNISKDNLRIYFNIYQQLGLAWEFLGLQCQHWDGYKKVRDKKMACRICGKIKDADNLLGLSILR